MEERTYNQYIDTEALSYYVELKNRLNTEGENFNYVMNHMPPTYASTDAYIKNYVSDLTLDELKSRADGLIRAQNLKENDGIIDYMASKNKGDFRHYRSQWSPIMWQAHEKENKQTVKIGDKIVNAYDLDFSIAETLELQDAHTDPVSEYHDWVKIQSHIETDIKTDGATCDEIESRNFFISFMDVRETEIKRIASLYAAAAFNPNSPMQKYAQEKLNFTLFKLSELRRLRDRMKATKSSPDKCIHKQKLMEKLKKSAAKKAFMPAYEPVIEENSDLSLGEQRIVQLCAAHAISHGISEKFMQYRPVSRTQDEALQKINAASHNQDTMREMLSAMRNGMSREEWLKSQGQPVQENKVIRSLRGFDINRYNQALRDLNK